MEKTTPIESPFVLPNSHFVFNGQIGEQTALTVGSTALRLIHLATQKPQADNVDCFSRGKKENGRFVVKGDLNFLAVEYFATRHFFWGGGLAFEVTAMSLGQLCQTENGEPHQKMSGWR